MISVFILDDHALVRSGYRLILQQHLDIQVTGEAESGEEGLQKIRASKPDVVLCDLHMPGLSGLEITERLNRGSVTAKVIIVSVQQDGPMPKRLLEAGACGYLGKVCEAEELVRAIRDVARGKRYLGNALA
jgi:two-component system invasion response regulator UvrY